MEINKNQFIVFTHSSVVDPRDHLFVGRHLGSRLEFVLEE